MRKTKHIFMSRIYFAAFAVLIITVSAGCLKDKTGNLTIVFKGTYGDDPLVMFDKHDYAFDEEIQFTKSDFYLTHFRITDGTGTVNEVVEVELVDLSYTNKSDAESGFEITIKDIPATTYSRIDFTIGLDQAMNATMPEDWPSSSPLSEPRYWDAWSSYIFAKMEGNLDTLGDGNADLGWLYHTGTDSLFVLLSANVQLSIPDGGTRRITFSLDHEKLFGVEDDPIDIKKNPVNHTPSDSEEITKIVGNYASSFSFVVE